MISKDNTISLNEDQIISSDNNLPKYVNENIYSDEDEYPEFDTIVLSGGSLKVCMAMGSLQYAYDNLLLSDVKNYIGTSAGAIICFLLLIGYSPIDIMVYIATSKMLTNVNYDIISMMNGTGIVPFELISDHVEKLILNKLGYIPTLIEIEANFGKNFICPTYNFTTRKAEYLSSNTYPDLCILTALRMTCNLPAIFEHYKYNDCFYIDGGVCDNFPIMKAEEIGTKILGIMYKDNIDQTELVSENGDKIGFVDYFIKMLFLQSKILVDHQLEKISNKSTIISLEHSCNSIVNLSMDTKTKLDLFSSGYQQMKSHFNK